MKDFPLEKYLFIHYRDNAIMAVSSYNGKTVKGTAKCNPIDEFDIEKGKQLAAARCNAKVAEKRRKKAYKKYHEALDQLLAARDAYDKAFSFAEDADMAEYKANEAVEKLLEIF